MNKLFGFSKEIFFICAHRVEDLVQEALEVVALYAEDAAPPQPSSLERVSALAADDLRNGGFLLALPVLVPA